MKQITITSHMSRYMLEKVSRHDISENIKLQMATEIAREILKKIEIRSEVDYTGDLKYTLSFFMTPDKKQADMINEMMPIIEKLYEALKGGHHSNDI